MAIKFKIGKNIFDSKCQALVNPVNIKGVSGKGLAKQFRIKCPKAFLTYSQACIDEEFEETSLLYCENEGERSVLFFPTKRHWKDDSDLNLIDLNLKNFCTCIKDGDFSIESIAFPMLGCGAGNLDQQVVFPVMRDRLKVLDILVEIYVR